VPLILAQGHFEDEPSRRGDFGGDGVDPAANGIGRGLSLVSGALRRAGAPAPLNPIIDPASNVFHMVCLPLPIVLVCSSFPIVSGQTCTRHAHGRSDWHSACEFRAYATLGADQ